MTQRKTRPFSKLSGEVRARPRAAKEIDARKRAIVAAVRRAGLRQGPGMAR